MSNSTIVTDNISSEFYNKLRSDIQNISDGKFASRKFKFLGKNNCNILEQILYISDANWSFQNFSYQNSSYCEATVSKKS